jgi:hypothetical protein
VTLTGGAASAAPLLDATARGGGLRTFTGRKVYPLKPTVEDIDIFDIAHSLSNLCRFAGHIHEFYSVAQHSVLASETAGKWTDGNVDLMKWCLMHDAAEAYLIDLPSPLKRMAGFGDGYRAAEKRLIKVIARRFDLTPRAEPDDVRFYDRIMLCTEQRDLYGHRAEPYVPSYDVPMLPQRIHGWNPEWAEEAFLTRFRLLFGSVFR